MLSSSCIVTFIDCNYSYSQREAVYDKIRLSKDDNILQIIMGLNSESVFVEVSKEHEKEYAAKFNQQYGGLIVVTDGVTDDLGGKEDTALTGSGKDKGNSLWPWTMVAVLFIAAASILLFNQTRFIPAMQTTKGTVVTRTAPISRKQTIEAIKNSVAAPSDKVFNSILHEIDKNDS